MKKRPWLAHLKKDKEECQPAEELKGSTSGTISSFKTWIAPLKVSILFRHLPIWDQHCKTFLS